YDRLATALAGRGLIDDAVAMHREALARLEKMSDYPLGGDVIPSLRLDFRAALADTLVTGKRGDEAIELIERDVAASADDALVHSTMGHIRARLGQWEKAAAAFTRSLALNPSESE